MSQLIYSKMAKILAGIGSVGKDSRNTQQGFNFRGIDSMINAVHSVLKANEVFVTTDILDKKSEIREVTRSNGKPGVDKIVELTVKYTFWAEDGSSVSSIIASEGLDSGDKATNKALSAALKYALIQTFQVPTQDMEDGDSESPSLESIPTKSKPEAQKSIASPATPSQAVSTQPTKPASFRGRAATTVSTAQPAKATPTSADEAY